MALYENPYSNWDFGSTSEEEDTDRTRRYPGTESFTRPGEQGTARLTGYDYGRGPRTMSRNVSENPYSRLFAQHQGEMARPGGDRFEKIDQYKRANVRQQIADELKFDPYSLPGLTHEQKSAMGPNVLNAILKYRADIAKNAPTLGDTLKNKKLMGEIGAQEREETDYNARQMTNRILSSQPLYHQITNTITNPNARAEIDERALAIFNAGKRPVIVESPSLYAGGGSRYTVVPEESAPSPRASIGGSLGNYLTPPGRGLGSQAALTEAGPSAGPGPVEQITQMKEGALPQGARTTPKGTGRDPRIIGIKKIG